MEADGDIHSALAYYREMRRPPRVHVMDRFHFQGKIGSGTYGVVFKAFSKEGNNVSTTAVAIKKFKGSGVEMEGLSGLSQSACREITLCRELKHENIVRLKQVILDPLDKSIYMIFDYAEYDLFQILHYHRENKRALPEESLKSILYQLLNGIAYLHANWVLHRDLKPANILVMGDGLERGIVKIADLGLARIYQAPLQPLTVMDKVIVTIWYRAPELLLGTKHYTKAIDTWAVGCILGELLTLRPLFKGAEDKPDKNNRVPFQKDQLEKIFQLLGMPEKEKWPMSEELADISKLQMFKNNYKFQLFNYVTRNAFDSTRFKWDNVLKLLGRLLEYDPTKRISAEEALLHSYFLEEPKPIRNSLACCTAEGIEYPKRALQFDEKEWPVNNRRQPQE